MKNKLTPFRLFVIFLVTSLTVKAGRESGGGDAYAIEFVQVAQQVSQHLKNTKSKMIDIKSLDEAITKTTVESTDKKLFLNKTPKDAINYPADKKIIFNHVRWKKISLATKPTLVLHEYLGILRIDDTGYFISNQVVSGFNYQGTAEENFRAGALATATTFPIITDVYSEGHGVGFILVAEIKTDARTRNNSMLVIGLPDHTSDTIKSTIDLNLDHIDSIQLIETDLVISGQLYDWNNDTVSPLEVRIKIKKKTGSSDYFSKLKVTKRAGT